MNLLRRAPGATDGTILGIRPEHLEVGREGWALTVEGIELLGAERLLYCRLHDEALIVRIHEEQLAPNIGETIYAKPRADRIHRFDARTGLRL
jgi:sn-glycerol 3-phosphate transport system ATP-binding protein